MGRLCPRECRWRKACLAAVECVEVREGNSTFCEVSNAYIQGQESLFVIAIYKKSTSGDRGIPKFE